MVSASINMIGFLLGVISFYVAQLEEISIKNRFIFAAIILAFSIGEYQCYITLFFTLAIVYILRAVLIKDIKLAALFKMASFFVSIAVVALILYLIILEVSLKITHLSLTDYAGTSSFGIVGFWEYIERLKISYIEFFYTNLGASYTFFPFGRHIWQYFVGFIIIILTLILGIYYVSSACYEKCIEIIAIYLIMPLVFNFNIFIYGHEAYHTLHNYNMVLLFLLPCILVEVIIQNDLVGTYQRGLRYFLVFFLLVFGLRYIRYASSCYTQIQLRMDRSLAYLNRMISRIEMSDGFYYDKDVVFAGRFHWEDIDKNLLKYDDVPVSGPYQPGEIMNSYSRQYLLTNYLGFFNNMEFIDEVDDGNLSKLLESMAIYPDVGSILSDDSKIIVKLDMIN